MKKTIMGLLIAGVALIFLFASCDALGSIAGDRDKLWQEVREGKSYKVTFNANGGDPVPPIQTIPYGEKAGEPEAMEKTGSLFMGWYKEAACIKLWDFDVDTVTKNTTLYAKWEGVPEGYHVVRFSITGAEPNSRPAEQTVKENDFVKQPDSPERIGGGYIFDKWLKISGNPSSEWLFDSDMVIDTDITLYGSWKKLEGDEQIVRFKTNGGKPVPADMAVNINNLAGSEPFIERDGKNFGGWYSDPSCTTPWLFDEYEVTGTTNLYAQWNEPDYYSVNFISRGGIPEPPQQIVKKGEEVSKPGTA